MAVTTTKTNKPINPRGNDQSPLAFNRAKLYSGKALDFDGVNDSVNLDGFTMAGDVATIVFYGQFDSTGYAIDINTQRFIIQNHNTFGFRVYNNNVWTAYGDTNRSELNFYAIVSDGTTQRAYYNGHQLGSDETVTALDWSLATQIRLGSDNAGSGSFLNGQLSNFKIFNTALTAAQVADLYNNPEKIVPTGVSNDALKLWLPMMEGAGTTAYDGSGNGNHGTISGATYVHGVGSPVAQTAVIDWNKGTNLVTYSENMVTGWTLQNVGASVNALESPDGLTTATKFTATAANTFHLNNFTYASAPAGIWKESVFAKKGEVDFAFLVIRVNGGTDRYGVKFDLTDGTFVDDITSGSPTNTGYEITDVGNGWYKCTVQASHTSGNITNVFGPNIAGNLVDINGSHLGDGISGMYFWGASLRLSTAGDSYVRTEASTQTSPVLLPQGLTSGRDITGVNLFENVRKQGALNLDGNSWAEVHDNASLDITDAITLEAWVYNDGSSFDGFLGRYFTTGDNRGAMIYEIADGTARMIVSKDGINAYNAYGTISQGWNHIVGTCDDTEIKIYINGVKGTDGTAPSGSIHVSSYPYEIGRYNANITTQHTNQIAQPRIYNRALTAEEVARNYNASKGIYQ